MTNEMTVLERFSGSEGTAVVFAVKDSNVKNFQANMAKMSASGIERVFATPRFRSVEAAMKSALNFIETGFCND